MHIKYIVIKQFSSEVLEDAQNYQHVQPCLDADLQAVRGKVGLA